MAIEGWPENKELGKKPCKTERETWQCPNMKFVRESWDSETYECERCGATCKLYDDEMR